jgi:molecular chaperone GrpE
MLKRRFSKQNDVKQENEAPEQKDAVAEKQEVANEVIVEKDSVENETPEPVEVSEPVEKPEPVEGNSAPEGNPEPEETTIDGAEKVNEELEAVRRDLAEWRDKYLRKAAEFENFRKRTHREKMELIQNAGESLLIDILPLSDDFDRGMEAASKAENMDGIRKGMDLIYEKLKVFLTHHGVKEINAKDEPFNADLHEAIANIPAPSDNMKGKIVDVIQKGYTLNDKVIRYPKVVVGE